jgi:hypothetical protein
VGGHLKYRAGKIKKEHSVIERLWPALEAMAACELIVSIIPSVITPLKSHGFEITFHRFTETGLRLLAKNGSALQEVYVVTEADHQETALLWLSEAGIINWHPPSPPKPKSLAANGEPREKVMVRSTRPCHACGRPILAGSSAIRQGTKSSVFLHTRCAI